MDEEESGWKYVHGDVFRFPPMKNLFCAFVGTGTQVREVADHSVASSDDTVWWIWCDLDVFDTWCILLPSQIFYLSLFIFCLALVGVFYPYNRGSLYTALIVLYALTASIAGYVAASYYKQMEGEFWVRNILLTCFIYCGPFMAMFSFLNTVAIVYRVGSCLVLSGCMPHTPIHQSRQHESTTTKLASGEAVLIVVSFNCSPPPPSRSAPSWSLSSSGAW